MHVRCPHCKNAIEIVGEDDISDVNCPSCGSSFNLVPETESYTPKTRTIGHFQLLEQLGAGGFGTVWKAKDSELDRFVAVKIPRRDQVEPENVEMFLREARAAAQLKHPQIVAVHEVGRDDGTLYIVSDFIQGVTLADRLTQGPFTPREAAELCAQIADALHHAHEAGVIHRDLKPQNIMLDGEGRPHIMDFGLAKREAGEITMTVDGKILGTAAYMSPEQARGEAHRVDRRTDVYSLGVVLFECLTGERPFRGNRAMLLHQVLHDEPQRPRQLNRAVPRDLETITLKCLEKRADRRYGSASEVSNELRRWLDNKPIQARPVHPVERVWRWMNRNRKEAAFGITIAMLFLLLAISWLGGRKTFIPVPDASNTGASESPKLPEQSSKSLTRVATFTTTTSSPGLTGKLFVLPTLRKGHVVIVLDCSASMAPWMGDANQAVRKMIDRLLVKDADVEVSLVLFGHRRSKDFELFGSVVRWKWNGAFGFNNGARTLFNDYAVVWRKEDGTAALDRILGKPDGPSFPVPMTKATGLTPLFSAVSFALSDGFTDTDTGSRQLVIISDGDDYVQTRREWEQSFLDANRAGGNIDTASALLPRLEFDPPWPKEEADYNSASKRRERANLVKQGIESRQARVHLFDLSKGGELAAAATLAGLGQPIVVRNPTELANTVSGQIGVFEYELDDEDARTDLSGRTTQTQKFDGLPVGDYTLRFSGQPEAALPFRISGGEALEVAADRDGHPRFEFLPEEPPLLDAQSRGRISLQDVTITPSLDRLLAAQCRAFRSPAGDGNMHHCTFELALYNEADSQFTPRPVELWAEIVPQGAEVSEDTYVFCNPFPKPETRSPVYELVVPNWPDSATHAHIWVWVRMQPTQSHSGIVDSSFASPKQLAASAASPGVRLQFKSEPHMGGTMVRISEIFEPNATRRWHFVTPIPNLGVNTVQREYRDRQVEHQFAFAADTLDTEQLRFLALPIDQWKDIAHGLVGDKPLIVRLPTD